MNEPFPSEKILNKNRKINKIYIFIYLDVVGVDVGVGKSLLSLDEV